MTPLQKLAKELKEASNPLFYDRGLFERLAIVVMRREIQVRIYEHKEMCMRCRSEVMMETGMANCKNIKELQNQLREIDNG